MPGIDADARPCCQLEQQQGASGGRKVSVSVLCVEASLRGVPNLWRHIAEQWLARGNEQLQLDQIEPGGCLGDCMRCRQSELDRRDVEGSVDRLVAELDGRHPADSRRAHERERRFAERGVLLSTQVGGTGFHDQRPVVSRHGLVADSSHPHGAVVVSDNMHIEVPHSAARVNACWCLVDVQRAHDLR